VPQNRSRKFGSVTGLRRWLARRDTLESDILDFKESIPDSDNTRKVFCAFANSGGGRIIFGVTDRKALKGMTISAQQLKDKLVQILGNNVYPATIRFEIIEEIKFLRGTRSIFVVEIFNSDYVSKPHIFMKNDAVYIPIRRNGSCDYLKNHAEIRSAFLLEGAFYQQQASDIKRILDRIRIQPEDKLNRMEQSLILRFRRHLSEQAQFDQQQGVVEKDLGEIIDEQCEIENLINSAVSGIGAYQGRIEQFRARTEKHLSNFSKYYE
jgi:predicted HTH transcriptional regulator